MRLWVRVSLSFATAATPGILIDKLSLSQCYRRLLVVNCEFIREIIRSIYYVAANHICVLRLLSLLNSLKLDKLSILPTSSSRVVLSLLTVPISNSQGLFSLDAFDDLAHLRIANLSERVDRF